MSADPGADEDWEACRAILENVRRIENRAWTALNNFLVANAFLLVAWATIYVWAFGSKSPRPFSSEHWLLVLLSAIGFLGSIQWCLIGARNWRYVQEWVQDLDTEEQRRGGVTRRVLTVVNEAKRRIHGICADPFGLSRQGLVLAGTPWLVGLVYAVALEAVIRPQSDACAYIAGGVEGFLPVYAAYGGFVTSFQNMRKAEKPKSC